eukprot:6994268-Pyramimonas_sp.AAC.1
MLLQASDPHTGNLVCKTQAATTAMSARRWQVHLCGRPSPAHGGQLVWCDRRGRGGVGRWALPNGHFSANR